MKFKKFNILLVAAICAAALLANGLIVLALTSSADTLIVTNTNDSGPESLRQAIADAENGDVITFDLPQGSIILLTSGPLVIENNISIIGPEPQAARQMAAEGGNTITIDGGNNDRIFQMDLQNFTLENLNLTGGNATTSALAPGFGGAVYQAGGQFTGHNLFFSSNRAPFAGGAIYNNGGTVDLSDTLFTLNEAFNTSSHGGAIANVGVMGFPASLTVNNVWFHLNKSALLGGAISNIAQGADSTVQALDFICSDNEAFQGSCIINSANEPVVATVTMDGGNIVNNFAQDRGAAANAGLMEIFDVFFIDNKSINPGSALISDGETILKHDFIESEEGDSTAAAAISPGKPPIKSFGNIFNSSTNCTTTSDMENLGYNLSNNSDCFPDGQNNSQVVPNLGSQLTTTFWPVDGGHRNITAYTRESFFDDWVKTVAEDEELEKDYHGVERPQGEGATPGPLESAGEIIVKKVINGSEKVPGDSYAIALHEENAFQFSIGPLPITHEAAVQNGDSHRFRLTGRAAVNGKTAITLVEQSTVLGDYNVTISCDNGATSNSNEIKMEVGPLEKITCTIHNDRKINLDLYLPIVIK